MTNKIHFGMIAAAGLSIALAAPAAAQQAAQTSSSSADHVVVPLSHPSQPATLKVSTLNGSITVKAYSGQDVVIDTSGGSDNDRRRRDRERNPPDEAAGMHRLNTNSGFTAEEDNNVVTVRTSVMGGGNNLVIQVPARTSVSLHCVNGSLIDVEGITGDISADATNGNITLDHDGGSIVASAMNGRILATVTQLDPSKPSSFSSLNGTIDVTLPADVKANLRMKTSQGDIYMDDGFNFQTTRTPAGTNQGQRNDQGMYVVKIDRTIYGTLNGGGPELRVENFNGNIYIRKAK